MPDIAANKERFIDIYKTNVTRDGADALLEYLCSKQCDFFTSPASTRFHGSYEGGLLEHSLNVYDCLKDYLARSRCAETYKMNYSEETIALTALLHDLCKANTYKVDFRNAKNDQGVWEKVPYFTTDDKLPYGHGEKSVYIINGYVRLTREEAFAIRYHMGFSGIEEKNIIGRVFEQFPLAFTADMEASYFLEGSV